MTIRVELPYHLRNLAGVETHEIGIEVEEPISLSRVLDAIEQRYPTLRGTIRDYETRQRRPLLRFFALNEDISYDSLDQLLPEKIVRGEEPLIILGAIAGGSPRLEFEVDE